jgi:hypothetical protein
MFWRSPLIALVKFERDRHEAWNLSKDMQPFGLEFGCKSREVEYLTELPADSPFNPMKIAHSRTFTLSAALCSSES